MLTKEAKESLIAIVRELDRIAKKENIGISMDVSQVNCSNPRIHIMDFKCFPRKKYIENGIDFTESHLMQKERGIEV